MRAVDIITKKRDGGSLTTDEIHFFIEGFTRGDIPDYQVAAWSMAVLLQGMDARETSDLTMALAQSGDQLDLSDVVDVALDKHSTGGVGDKTTLVVAPIVSACGVPVGKMSGGGLGFTGGTLDKMESIPGYDINLDTRGFKRQLAEIGIVLSGPTAVLAPADGKLYALRDVTGTVPSIPLIASSVMSKKIAGGADAIVLDVKVGLGAFMQDLDDGEELARLMVEIGVHAERQVIALLSDMNQPLGVAVGNALEVKEAVNTLHGGGPGDFREHSLVFASNMLLLSGRFEDFPQARAAAEGALEDGSALKKFIQLVDAQGGDVSVLEDLSKLPSAPVKVELTAGTSGYIHQIHAREVGLTAMELGAGRAKKGDAIDHAVGIEVLHNVGDEVEAGDAIAVIHARSEEQAQQAVRRLEAAHGIKNESIEPLALFYGTIGRD
ncbi:MAG: thymidine phosphorylase [Anaerolineales bacterium]|nr:thymidine phosphorylase [Anaerolineales bacterium]